MAIKPSLRLMYRIGLISIFGTIFSFAIIKFSFDGGLSLRSNFQLIESNDSHTSSTAASDKSKSFLLGLSQDFLAPQLCSPKTKIIFAKTHKTGSSTVQNIFMRFGYNLNLTFVLPNRRTWMFPLIQTFSATMAAPKPNFDLMLFHHIWNETEIKKLIPKGLKFTLLRDPVDTFESGYVYLGLQKGYRMDINQFALKRARFGAQRPNKAIFNKNPQLYDLGLNQSKMEDPLEVIQKIEQIEKEFDFVMIAEQMDESLVLLQDILCWPLIDLTYLRQNERKPTSKSNMTDETRRILREWLWADYLLYNHFVDKFTQRKNEFGSDYLDFQVDRFRKLNKKVMTECVISHADNSQLKGSYKMALDIALGYVIDESKEWCKNYALSEPSFWKMIYKRQNVERPQSFRPNSKE